MPERPKPEPQKPEPLPVDVISSVPLSVQLAPESLASLGAPPAGTAEPVTATTATSQAILTPQTAPAGEPVNVTVVAPPPSVTVTKGEGVTLSPRTTEQEDIVVGRQAEIGKIWEWTQSVLSVFITLAVIYAELTGVSSVTLGNAFFFVVSLYLIRTNHSKIGGEGPKANEIYRGR